MQRKLEIVFAKIALRLPKVRLFALTLCVVFLSSCGKLSDSQGANQGVVSLDYCADQFVLKFVPREKILALSPDAEKYFSYFKELASGLPTTRPLVEDVLSLRPKTVVRSYGGGTSITSFLAAADINIIQLGYPNDFASIKGQVIDIATALGAEEAGKQVVLEMEQRQQRLTQSQNQANKSRKKALYVTPGGVTTGPGSLVHEALLEAKLDNYEQRSGWHDLPLEQLVYTQPELVAFASFGATSTHVDPWTLARHPLVKELLSKQPVVEVEGAWTSCGAWFLMDAVEALSQSTTDK